MDHAICFKPDLDHVISLFASLTQNLPPNHRIQLELELELGLPLPSTFAPQNTSNPLVI